MHGDMDLSRRFVMGQAIFDQNITAFERFRLTDCNNCFRIGLLVPMCGAAGLWGPSCIASAQIALSELNAANGIMGKQVEFVLIDSAIESEDILYHTIHEMIERQEIDAIVGMQISAVRQQLAKVVRGRVPHVYTPLYEGGENSPGVYAIGETPSDQLLPAIQAISSLHKVKNWALIGSDYVWPRASNFLAKQSIRSLGGNVAIEDYVPFGVDHTERLLYQLEEKGVDAVLISFVGQDSIDFNRAFGAFGLDQKIVRLSCAIEENCLLAIGDENSKKLYSSSSYFSVLDTPSNNSFKERYHSFHGERAPALNSIGQSLYEGVQFLAELTRMQSAGQDYVHTRSPIKYRSARDACYINNKRKTLPMYLARADGYKFSIVEKL